MMRSYEVNKMGKDGGSSRLQRTCWRILAAFLLMILLAIVILIWIQIGHAFYKPKKHFYNFTLEEDTSTSKIIYKESTPVVTTTEEYITPDDLEGSAETEYVRPFKISPPPLHDHDIQYDKLRNNHGHPPIRHHSGHFRRKTAEVWDPHPHYEIDAFGHKYILELAYNDQFVSPKLRVIQVWQNYTKRVEHDPKTWGCYYTGSVKGDANSNVAVSLCNGMTGWIKTSEGNFYIQPVEQFPEDSASSILHKIRKLSTDSTEELDCETRTEVEDDAPEHRITRRSYELEDDNSRVYHASTHPYFIETMVVADKKMVEYHKTDTDLFDYILTLMSHVALLFKDATIGNPINLTVVDIMILKDTDFTSVTSQEMLRKFCEYQLRYSTIVHDVALLLTRDVICKNATMQYCSTLGVAEVGSMCSPSSSCAIVRDKGLSTSYTIAHELGHVLSMPHDDDKKCLKYQGASKPNKIMSKMLHNDTKPWHWSACSKHFLTEFLDSPRSRCLLDVPTKDYMDNPTSQQHLPGERFEVNKQCELEFGKGSKMCTFMPYCSSLWCTAEHGESGGCKTQHMPWADGTSCGRGRWCHHGKCVELDRNILSPVAGAWGDWKEWGPCTRPCGGGIMLSKRECNNPPPRNGGPYCMGGSARYSSCNIQPCQNNDRDFREEQCAKFNGHTKGIPSLTNKVKWVPKYGITNPDDYCKLYCRVQHSTAYYQLQEKVIDGTKCGLNSFDICVNGICKAGGCDNQLGSNVTLDDCGVCGGDNGQCQVISGFYNVSGTYGYNKVARIPKGSSSIFITQTGFVNSHKDENYLALRDGDTKDYILNGNFIVSTFEKEIIYGGVTIIYSGSDMVIEHIRTPRNTKLSKDIIIEVLTVGTILPPDINYTYTIGNDAAPRYSWSFYGGNWSNCDSICSGLQHPNSICVDLAHNQVVSDEYCNGVKNIEPLPCNSHCKLDWVVVAKSECSIHCGTGQRKLMYKCVKQSLGTSEKESVGEKHCNKLPLPPTHESCEGSCESTRWEYDNWSVCSKSCGGGEQFRTAVCVDSKRQSVDDSHCNLEEKHVQQTCNTNDCPRWFFGEWTPCSVTCGVGYRTKPYKCHVNNHLADLTFCNSNELHKVKEECDMGACPPENLRWSARNWSKCSNDCGEGTQWREVLCVDDHGTVEEFYCMNLLRPNSTKECVAYNCQSVNYEDNKITSHQFNWETGDWSQCSHSCNTGYKSRMVVCRNDKGIEMEKYCDYKRKPVHRTKCNAFACPQWKIIGRRPKCDANCKRTLQVICQDYLGARVDRSQCNERTRPNSVVKCKKGMCSQHDNSITNGLKSKETSYLTNLRWKEGPWSTCSNSCGKGNVSRTVSCFDYINNITCVDGWCKNLRKPKTVKECERRNCKFLWLEGPWSTCSVSCGRGTRTRSVTCHEVLQGGYTNPEPQDFKSPHDDYCDVYSKPRAVGECNVNCQEPYRWQEGPWSECSHSCGKGRQNRRLTCVDRGGNKVRRHLCPRVSRPKRKKKCNLKNCLYESCLEVKHLQRSNENHDYLLSVNERLVEVYCYKMDTEEPEEFISLKPGKENYAEIYHKRLEDSLSCPYDGRRRDDCDCVSLSENSGRTIFWKVRLNITSLQIIANDFTFSRQVRGTKVPYGTAGDCYSESGTCPQGRFSIDLTGTAFRLSKNVDWIGSGNKYSKDIRRYNDVKVSGLCGGYCGNCEPDPRTGLKVEIT